MPILTRSKTTGPVRMMTGVKRKFIEILESDNESEIATDSDPDSEYELNVADELEDTIQDLKEEIKDSEESNDALIDMLIKERETSRQIRQELEETQTKYSRLLDDVKEYHRTTLSEAAFFTAIIGITFGTCLASLYTCSQAVMWE